MTHICVGIDISKDKFDISVRDWKNRPLFGPKEYSQDLDGMMQMKEEIERVAKEVKARILLGCESTGIYHLPLLEFCDQHDLSLLVFNALELKKYHKSKIRKQRNDPIDADTIARALVIEGEFPDDTEIPPEVKTLRELTRVRHRIKEQINLVKTRTTRNMDIICRGYSRCFKNVMSPSSRAVLKRCVQLVKPFNTSEEELVEILKKFRHPSYPEKAKKLRKIFDKTVIPEGFFEGCVLEIKFILKLYKLLSEQIKKLDAKIERIVEDMDTPIKTITGIKEVNAGIILGEIASIDRFNNINELVAFSGLDPSRRVSGQYEAQVCHISKRGSPYLRSALYMSALTAKRANPVCKAFAKRLEKKGKKPKVVIVAVARKLLTIVYSVLKNNRKFYIPKGIDATKA